MEQIQRKKNNVEDLGRGLPDEFATYLTYGQSLQHAESPDDMYLPRLFSNLFAARAFQSNNIFDWTEKRFYELQTDAQANNPI